MRLPIVGICFAATVGLAGCEHPTAPQARAAIEKAEQRLLTGDYQTLQAGLTDLVMMAHYYGSNRRVPSDSIVVMRDGEPARMLATVVERVYLPPAGSAARPLTRRSVIAWSDEGAANYGRNRVLVLLSNDTESKVAVPTVEAVTGVRFEPLGFALGLESGDRRAWFGIDGTLRISEGVPIAECPYSGRYGGYSTGIAELQDSTTTLSCDTRSYSVSLSTILERGDPDKRSSIDMLRPLRATVRTANSSIRGVRFVMQCKGTMEMNPSACMELLSFWRHNGLFAKSLGFDVAALGAGSYRDIVWQTISAGDGPDYRMVLGGYDVPVSYVVRTPDGDVLRRRDRTTGQTDSLLQRVPYQEIPQRIGSRIRMVMPARVVNAGASRFDIAILELTFLPFSGDVRRNQFRLFHHP